MTPDPPRERLTFWWEATGAAWALARALEQGPPRAGCRALELGCGPGLAGIAAARRGAHVTFTDGEAEALDLARDNARSAGLPPEATAFRLLDWEHPGEVGTFDLVLGSEIAYDYWVHDDLLRLIDALVAPAGACWLADRPRLAIDRFLGRLAGAGFVCEREAVAVDRPGLPDHEVHLFRLSRCSPCPR